MIALPELEAHLPRALHHGARHVVKTDHTHQFLLIHHRQVARMAFKHHAAQFVDVSFHGAGQGLVLHDGAHHGGTDVACGFNQDAGQLPYRQHAHQFAMLHDHQRADVALLHLPKRVNQQIVRRRSKQRCTLDAQNITDFHGIPFDVEATVCRLMKVQYSPQF
ncbi:hypothetical protein GALL_513160 [mine drainage metagenome]|uniref:Uncharacterized protein n=1 Tax=mine drainage metagenome TaxID=410659 RepID=A0A1J5PHU6_9ZZZZ